MARSNSLNLLAMLVLVALVLLYRESNHSLTHVQTPSPKDVLLPPSSSVFTSSVTLDEATRLIAQKEDEEAALEELEFQRSGKPKRIRVCTIALNPRQGSLFRTNYLGEMGSGRFKYVPKAADCPWDWPRVRLISYVKCCTSLKKVQRTINVANNEFDIMIVTGDEYCHVNDPRAQFRQYHGTNSMALSKPQATTPFIESFPQTMLNSNQYPIYIPLGPREEFLYERIKDFKPASQRKYVYNFLGSMTSPSRSILKSVLGADLATAANTKRFPNFLHITDKWHIKVTKSNGYIEPDQYKRVLLDSMFTLCPTGHNPEAYRIYEALEAGSIPVLGLDRYYRHARCHDAFKPFIEANAPFVYLGNGWQGLEEFLQTKGSNATWITEQQDLCVKWYRNWMKQTALRFEAILDHRYHNRMERGPGSKTQELDEEEEDLQTEETLAVLQEEDADEEDEDGDKVILD
ncbi:hypothetical protein BASA82_000140 [Batrachochytrium salamandrivorans]|nr:hypothetical protein BASA81_001632 [Batrachochytrium salamandrivorans]KAH9262848.1 hypothetical protein BASA82_000140 [Batrachochytrium salamandrivorans]